MDSSGDGKSNKTAFKTLNEAIGASSNDDIIMIASGQYTGENNIGVTIYKNLNFIKYGDGEAIFDARGLGRIWTVSASSINITGLTFKNGKANNGGAIYFKNDIFNSNIYANFINNIATRSDGGANVFQRGISGSNISGVYVNNTAVTFGGANLFEDAIFGSNISGSYINNKATRKDGGANYFENIVSGSNVFGVYANNTAAGSGGANFFGFTVSGSNVFGVYANNTAAGSGGANYFGFSVSDSNVDGIYINNAASNATICFEDSLDIDSDANMNANIINAIFLNNKCGYEIYLSTEGSVVVKDSWFGNNASNYMNKPNINDNVKIDNWLFLNATADYSSFLIMDSSNITFKLYSTDGRYVDNSKLPVVNLTLTAINGDVDKTTTLDKIVKYMATEYGKGSVTAKIENASYTICFDNILRNVDLSVSAQNITYLENEILTLTYNNTATGKINITLKSKNYNKIIKADINQTITIADLPAGKYGVTIRYSGDNVFSNAVSYANFAVEKITTEIILDKETIDLFVDDEYNITYILKPDYALGNISFSCNDSNIVSVDSVSGDIITKAEGSATITVSFSGSENYTASDATITVNVKKIPTQITVNSSFIDMKVNDERDICAILEPANAGNLTYKSSDENIVKVENGNVKGLKEGNATITVSFAGNSKYLQAENKTINVTVKLNGASVSVNNNTLDLLVDDTFNFVATTEPKDLIVNFTSKNLSVVTVDNKGNVVAISEGNATIVVSVGGDGVYAENSTTVAVTVNKVPTEINIENANVSLNVGDDVSTGAALNPEKAGNLTYKSGDESIAIVKDGKIIALKEGDAIITVSFAGDNKYATAENKTIKVTVKKVNALMNVSAEDITEGENATISVTLPDDATGNVTTTVNGKTYSLPVENGKTIITIPDLEYGNYTLPVTFSGDDKYNSIETSVNVTVNPQPVLPKENLTISAIANPITVGEDATVVVTGFEDATGNVTVTVGEGFYTTEIVNGTAIVIILGLKENTVGQVSYPGDDNYNNASTTVDIVVNPVPKPDKDNLTISASANPITVGNNVTIVVTGLENATGDISVIVNGKTYAAHIMDGEATVTVPGLTENVVAIVNYVGDDLYNPASTTVNITVNPKGKENATIVIDAPSQATKGDNVTVSVTLPEDATGTVTIGNEVVPVQNGTASAVLTNIPAGNTTIPIIYSGDDKYNQIETNVNIMVNEKPVPPKENLTLEASVNPIIVGEDAVIVVTGFEDATGNVTAKVGNGVYTISIVDGTATFTISGLIENVTAAITYAGDDRYNSASTTVDIVVNPKGKENATIFIDTPSQATEGDNVTVSVTLPGDATGTVTIGNEVVPVQNGVAGAVLTNIPPGNITVPIIYSGDDKYNPIETKVTIDVDEKSVPSKEDLNPSVSVDPITVGEDAVIVVSDLKDATGNVTAVVNGKTYAASIKDGKVNIAVPDLTENVTALISYSGDDKYNNFTESVDITVNPKPKENATMNIDVPPVTEGQNTTVNVELPKDATGNVTAVVDGKTYTAPVKDGKAIITISDLAAGNYTVPVTYSGDDKYNSLTEEVNIVVDEIKSDIIEAPDVTKYFGGHERFIVNVTDYQGKPLANKSVTISINGRSYDKTTDANGTASIALGLNSGVYNATVTVDNKTINSVVTILSTVNGTDIIKVFRNGTQYFATFRDGEGNYLKDSETVIFNIHGVMYERKVSGDKGLAKLNINLNPGEYVITAMNPITGDMTSNNITVLSRITENADLVKYYRNASQYTVKVLGDDGKAVGAGENVRFNINGVFYERQTNASGVAKLNINLMPGDYIITAEYKGCAVSNNIKVLPVLNAIDIRMKYRDGTQFKATLVDGQGKPYAGQNVAFNINGVLYNRPTDSSGTAKLNINLMSGEYIITSSYNGSSISNKITING